MNRRCEKTGKRCFRSEREAKKGMRRLAHTLRVYLCEFCRFWHLTSKRGDA